MIVNLTFLAPLTLRVDLADEDEPVGDAIITTLVETPNVASMRELFDEGRISIDDHDWNMFPDEDVAELRDRLIAVIDATDWPTPELVS